jgi:signal transduction histidine kinase/ligand-binding sensor domain-containing protein
MEEFNTRINASRHARSERMRAWNGFMRLVTLFITGCAFLAFGFPDYTRSEFTRLTVEQGLSSNIINCILQDRKGFLWIGTANGLNRYDGYRFTAYKADPVKAGHLVYNVIETLYEDREGGLWIGTDDGLSRFDRENETFTNFKNNPSDPASLSHNNVYCIQQDSSGLIWLGTFGGGLNALDPATGRCVRYRTDPKNPNSLSHDIVRTIHVDRKGRLWIGTEEGGLNRFDPGTGTFIRYRHDPNNPGSLSHDIVMAIDEDASGRLWIGTWGGGLDCMDPAGNRFIHHRHNADDPKSLVSDIITRLCRSYSGDLWIGTWNAGMDRLSLIEQNKPASAARTFLHHRLDHDDPSSLSGNGIWSLAVDHTGVLWIGTVNGLNKNELRRKKFGLFRADRPNGRRLPGNDVRALFEDGAGGIWIAMRGEGVSRFDRVSGKFVHYRKALEAVNTLGSNDVMAFAEGPGSVTWIGTDGRGIDRFDGRTGLFTHYRRNPKNPNSLSNDYVFQLLFESPSALWAGTYGGSGLTRLDIRTGSWTRFPIDTTGRSKNAIRKLYQDSSGRLWIGTNEQGLICFHPKTKVMERFLHDPASSTGLSSNTVQGIYEDENRKLWIGTLGGGLNRLDPLTKQFIRYGVSDGLPGDVICGILEDKRGNLWISTDKGLAKLDRLKKTFRNFDKSDGLQDNVFNADACCRLKTGELCFGGIGGFNVFHPDSIRDNPFVPEVVISNFSIMNRSVATGDTVNGRVLLRRALEATDEIVLTRKENMFSFEFAALHYADPLKNRYAYRLADFDADWIFADARNRTATYTNLDPGVYTFKVKASNNDGVWNEIPASVRVRILPVFWQTLRFKIVGGFGLIFMLAALALIRERSLGNRQAKLDLLIRERTAEVKGKTEELESTNRRLSEANSLLQTTNLERTRSQRLLQKAVADLRRSNDELAQFAYIASHDLQEPLRMVASYVSLLSRRYQGKLDPQADEFIAFAVEGSKRMQQLINDLLSYSRVTTKGKSFQTVDVNALLESVLLIMQITIAERRARITHDPLPRVTGDPIQIEQLLQNLISNGIKYCRAGTPEIRISVDRQDGEFRFSVRDNGIGIAPEHHEKIFGIFQRLHSREEYGGTGIGLAICRKIVERHGGRIWVESEAGQGATFFFTLPAA